MLNCARLLPDPYLGREVEEGAGTVRRCNPVRQFPSQRTVTANQKQTLALDDHKCASILGNDDVNHVS
jgi:hypothetical protein